MRYLKTLLLAASLVAIAPPVFSAFKTTKAVEQTTSTQASAATSSASVSTATESSLTEAQSQAAAAKFGGSKSKTVAALLAFFLGGFGIHRFYMGQKKQGFMQLGLYVVGLILYLVGVASLYSSAATGTVSAGLPIAALLGSVVMLGVGIWALIDFVRILIGSLEPEGGFDS